MAHTNSRAGDASLASPSSQPPHTTATAGSSSSSAAAGPSSSSSAAPRSRFQPMPLYPDPFNPMQLHPGAFPIIPPEGYEGDQDDEDDEDGDEDDDDEDEDYEQGHEQSREDGRGSDGDVTTESSALVQPIPNPLPDPYIINRPTNHNTPPYSFGTKLDLISPKLLHDTLMSPVPQGRKFMCKIVRKNEGMDKRMYPTYELWLEEPVRQRRVFLLRATKKKRSRGSYYAITSDMDNIHDYDRKASEENYGVLGKLRSNFLGTAFHVYSNGRNPFSSGDQHGEVDESGSNVEKQHNLSAADKEKGLMKKENKNKNLPVRQELGAVIYNPNVLGLKGPRKMTILMNTMTVDGSMVEKRPTQVKDTLIGRMTDGDMSDLLILRNKSPQWNDETNSFVLNFGGRVALASVKNFQIVHDNDLDYIIMQFGRTTQDNFTMDCQYPMTPFQAFAFALTSFDAKLACE